jgi:uncharacterized protein (TIGR00297 family)
MGHQSDNAGPAAIGYFFNSLSSTMPQPILGFILAAIISLLAYGIHSLSQGGALAALLLGTVIFGWGGWEWAILLLVFFISSSALSRLAKRRKVKLDEKFSKGSRRDAGQVAANGGIAGIFVLLHLLFPGAGWPWLGFAASLAAANADTWATELGVLNPRPPRLITSGKAVENGTSGAISLTGTLAALAGALLLSAAAVAFWPGSAWIPLSAGPNQLFHFSNGLAFFLLIGFAGLAGSLVDSLLGATLQAIYFCPECKKETERFPLHSCGNRTYLIRGLSWLNNDWVNTICTIAGAGLALIIYFAV